MKFSKELHHSVDGGVLLAFGDTHFSSLFQGEHRDYRTQCIRSMELLINHVLSYKKKYGKVAVVFMGDLIGVSERKISDGTFLLQVMQFFQRLHNLTDGKVFVVRGNHDIGDFPTFEVIKGLGYFSTPTEVDFISEDGRHLARLHFVGYGEEKRPLRYVGVEEGVPQVVFGHNDYSIPGITSWYYSRDAVPLSAMENFKQVDWVISGHIHHPSPEIYSTAIGSTGHLCNLLYLGAVNRVSRSEKYDDALFFTLFENSEGEADYTVENLGLPKPEEVFYSEEELIALGKIKPEEDVDEDEVKKSSKRLSEILDAVMRAGIGTTDLISQVDVFTQASEEARETAKRYLQDAVDQIS